MKFVIGGTLTILSWDNPVTAYFRKSRKLRHSLGRPSRSDFVQREVIQTVTQRIKTPESIYAKLVRKNLKPDFAIAKSKLNDLIGIRIVCLFVDDVYEIAKMLKNQKMLKLRNRIEAI